MRSSPAVNNSKLESLELGLLAFFLAIWLLAILSGLGLLPLAGTLDLDLYRLYSIAAVLGWVAGNIYVSRSQSLDDRNASEPDDRKRSRKRLLLSYLIQPQSCVYLLRTLAPFESQQAAPLVPIYAFGVYSLFFLVPLTLRATRTPRRTFRE